MPSRERAKGGSAPEASGVRACETAEVASPSVTKSVISAVVKLRREQIRMTPLCSRDREHRQLPTMEIRCRARARLHIGRKVATVGGQKIAADASSTPVASGSVRIGREPIDDLKEVLRQCLFGQCLIVAPELPPYLREERGVCHRICRSGVDAQAPIT